MTAMRRRWRPGFLVSRIVRRKSRSLRRLHELEEVPLRIFERHDASPRIIADLAHELHALVSQTLDIGSEIRGLQGQDRSFRRGLALRRIEPHADPANVHRTPVVALFRHRQIQKVAVEGDRALHVLDFVVDVLNARDHRPHSEMGESLYRAIIITRARSLPLSRRAPPQTRCSTGASQSSSVPRLRARARSLPPSG